MELFHCAGQHEQLNSGKCQFAILSCKIEISKLSLSQIRTNTCKFFWEVHVALMKRNRLMWLRSFPLWVWFQLPACRTLQPPRVTRNLVHSGTESSRSIFNSLTRVLNDSTILACCFSTSQEKRKQGWIHALIFALFRFFCTILILKLGLGLWNALIVFAWGVENAGTGYVGAISHFACYESFFGCKCATEIYCPRYNNRSSLIVLL